MSVREAKELLNHLEKEKHVICKVKVEPVWKTWLKYPFRRIICMFLGHVEVGFRGFKTDLSACLRCWKQF